MLLTSQWIVKMKPEIRLQMKGISLQRQQRESWIHRQIRTEAVQTFWMRFIKQQKQMTITSATQMILKTWRLPKQKKNIF